MYLFGIGAVTSDAAGAMSKTSFLEATSISLSAELPAAGVYALVPAAVANPTGLKVEVKVDCTDKRSTLELELQKALVAQGTMRCVGAYPDTPDGAPRFTLTLQKPANVSLSMELNESCDELGVQLHVCKGVGTLGLQGLIKSSTYLGGSTSSLTEKLPAGQYTVVPAAVSNSIGASVQVTAKVALLSFSCCC